MRIDAGQLEVRFLANPLDEANGQLRLDAAAAHAGFEIDMQVQHLVGAAKVSGSAVHRLQGCRHAVKLAIGAGGEKLGRLGRMHRFQDQDRFAADPLANMDGLMDAADGVEIHIGQAKDLDHLADAVAVGVGLNDRTKPRAASAQAAEVPQVIHQGPRGDVGLQVGSNQDGCWIDFHAVLLLSAEDLPPQAEQFPKGPQDHGGLCPGGPAGTPREMMNADLGDGAALSCGTGQDLRRNQGAVAVERHAVEHLPPKELESRSRYPAPEAKTENRPAGSRPSH